MADKKTEIEEEKDSRVLDLKLAEFTEPDVKKSVNDAQKAPRVIGRLITLMIIVSIIIVTVMIVKKKEVIKKISSYIEKVSKEKTVSRSAFYSWKKRDDQQGFNPAQRSGGPFEARIIRCDEKLSFIVYPVRGSKKYGRSFNGRKDKDGVFRGFWIDPFNDTSGRWELGEDIENPKILRGLEFDDYCFDGKPSILEFWD